MGPHINADGKFQSDKYPTCPAGKVPLSVEDPTAQDLLWEYAQRRREIDTEFADDLEWALDRAHYDFWDFYQMWQRWFEIGERQMSARRRRLAGSLGETERPRSLTASFMRWLAGEELLGNGPMSQRRPWYKPSSMIGHLELVHDSLHALRDMLRHVGYTETETAALIAAFKIMFPQVPEYVHDDIRCMHSSTIFGTIYCAPVSDTDLRQTVVAQVGEHFDEAHYVAALKELEGRCVRRDEKGDWAYFERGKE